MYAPNKTHITKIIYAENYKILVKEIKEDLNKWRDKSCSSIRIQHSTDVSSPQVDL